MIPIRYLPALFILLLLGNGCRSQNNSTAPPPAVSQTPPLAISETGDTLLSAPGGFVTDINGSFTSAEKARLETLLVEYSTQTTNQIAVVTLPENITAGELTQYSKDLFNHWGIGQKDKNNGVLITLSVPHRTVRITTGLGIEEQLDNAAAKEIIETFMTPRFKEGRYADGIEEGIRAIVKVLSL